MTHCAHRTTSRGAVAVALASALAAAGCNATDGAGSAPATSLAATTPSAGPSGTPCAGEIGRYQAVVRDDLATGNLNRKVYDQIQGELSRAAAACAAGKGGEAHALVASSKARHGYRA